MVDTSESRQYKTVPWRRSFQSRCVCRLFSCTNQVFETSGLQQAFSSNIFNTSPTLERFFFLTITLTPLFLFLGLCCFSHWKNVPSLVFTLCLSRILISYIKWGRPESHVAKNISVASLVGTWLRSLCTLLGLLGVISQLRGLLKCLSNNQDERVWDAAGAWASC